MLEKKKERKTCPAPVSWETEGAEIIAEKTDESSFKKRHG